MDQKIKVGELLSMNSERPGIIHIFEDEKITIGRDEENTNRIDDNRIAYFHCSIFYQDGQVVLKNLCAQGTFLNKERIGIDMEVNLEHGDSIHLLCQKGKKVTEKHVIAYVFYKCEKKKQSARKSSKCHQPILEQISDDLLCIICQELFYEGVAVSPCGHVFCGYCLQVWEDKNDTCPICRVKMRNITKAFQVNKIISSILELNPHLEQKEKPKNKYFLQAGENDEQSESESDSDSDSYNSDSENENENIGRLQIEQFLRRQQNNNELNNGQLIAFNNLLFRYEGPVQPPQQQQPVPQNIQQVQQNGQQNVQQNAQQNAQLNAQQNRQQNAQAQIVQAQMAQAQNPLAQAQNVNAQQNIQPQNALANQQRAIIQPPPQAPLVNQQRANNPPPRQNNNQQRPPINAQGNQQRVQQHPQLQQNAQINQRRPNVNPPVQINQPRPNPNQNLNHPQNQVAQQNQQRANPPPPVVVAQQNGYIVNRVAPNPPQNQAAQQIQVRVNPPQQRNAQAPHRHNQAEDNNVQPRQDNIQVQIQQPPQLQNPIPEMIQQQQLQNQYQQARNRECKSCNVEYKGFKCPQFQQHELCYCCYNRMPERNLNTHENADLKLFCQVCKNYFCKYYYGQCDQVQEHDIQELISYREGFSFQDIYFNPVEQERISKHLDGKDQSTIFDFIVQLYISREQFYFQKNKALFQVVLNDVNELLLPNSPVCEMCIRDVKRQIIFRYVQSFKFEEVEFMMIDCWYGINCRRQNDLYHARLYNHICEQTTFY